MPSGNASPPRSSTLVPFQLLQPRRHQHHDVVVGGAEDGTERPAIVRIDVRRRCAPDNGSPAADVGKRRTRLRERAVEHREVRAHAARPSIRPRRPRDRLVLPEPDPDAAGARGGREHRVRPGAVEDRRRPASTFASIVRERTPRPPDHQRPRRARRRQPMHRRAGIQQFAFEPAAERHDEVLPHRRVRRRRRASRACARCRRSRCRRGARAGRVSGRHGIRSSAAGTSIVSPGLTTSLSFTPLTSCMLAVDGAVDPDAIRARPFRSTPPAMAITCMTVISPSRITGPGGLDVPDHGRWSRPWGS